MGFQCTFHLSGYIFLCVKLSNKSCISRKGKGRERIGIPDLTSYPTRRMLKGVCATIHGLNTLSFLNNQLTCIQPYCQYGLNFIELTQMSILIATILNRLMNAVIMIQKKACNMRSLSTESSLLISRLFLACLECNHI